MAAILESYIERNEILSATRQNMVESCNNRGLNFEVLQSGGKEVFTSKCNLGIRIEINQSLLIFLKNLSEFFSLQNIIGQFFDNRNRI